MLPDEGPSPKQIEIYQRMTPGERWEAAQGLYRTARAIKTSGVRSQHPEWTQLQVEAEVRRLFLHARS